MRTVEPAPCLEHDKTPVLEVTEADSEAMDRVSTVEGRRTEGLLQATDPE